MTSIKNAALPSRVLERSQRLSDSMLWQLQRQFFRQQSIDAWRHSIVPHYVTSNTFIAQAYARLVFGYLRDLVQDSQQPLNLQQPLYVLELGAGSGRFSCHFLHKFFTILQQSALRHLPVKYVMSDISEDNLLFWQQHDALQPYIRQGLLDFALLDLSDPKPAVLKNAGVTLGDGTLDNPLVVIANYVFDGIEQDAFYVDGGVLHECLVSLHDQTPPEQRSDNVQLDNLRARFANAPLPDSDYYPEPEFNRILSGYQYSLTDCHVLLPLQALRCLALLRQWSGDRLLLVSGDKGYSREADLRAGHVPAIARHGSVSFMVNYHAIGQYVEQQQGLFMTTPYRHHHLHLCAAVFDPQLHTDRTSACLETRQAFSEHICAVNPDDFYGIKYFMQRHGEDMTLEEVLCYLRLSGWDAAIFWICYGSLLKHVKTLEASLRPDIAELAEQVWNNYYWLGEERDLAYALAGLLYEIDAYSQAISYLQHSRTRYGDEACTLNNLAMCHYNLLQPGLARELVQQALQLDPAYAPAQEMLMTIESELV